MAAITSRTFTVKLSNGSEPRAARRVVINSDALKIAKLSTGELVVLTSGVDSSSKCVEPVSSMPLLLLFVNRMSRHILLGLFGHL